MEQRWRGSGFYKAHSMSAHQEAACALMHHVEAGAESLSLGKMYGAVETALRRSSRRRRLEPEEQPQPVMEEVPEEDQEEIAAGELGEVLGAEAPVTVAQEDGTVAQEEETVVQQEEETVVQQEEMVAQEEVTVAQQDGTVAQEDGTVAQEEETVVQQEETVAQEEVTVAQEEETMGSGKAAEVTLIHEPVRQTHEKVPSAAKRKREAPIRKDVPQGKPKSGRVWKDPNKKRFSSMVKDRPLRTSWEVKMKERQEKKMVKSLAQQLKDEKQREKEEKKKRREENIRRRLENERKAEVVQVIRNPAKLKRARKKQLRNIEKRDTLMMSSAGKKLSQKKTAPVKANKESETVPR